MKRKGKTKRRNILFRTIAGTVDGNSPAKEKRTLCAEAEKKKT